MFLDLFLTKLLKIQSPKKFPRAVLHDVQFSRACVRYPHGYYYFLAVQQDPSTVFLPKLLQQTQKSEHIGTIRHITPTADSNAYMLIIHIHYSKSSMPILHTCKIDLLFLSYLGLPDSIMHASFFKLFNDIKHNRLSRNLIHRDAFECLCKVRMRNEILSE